MGHWTNIEVIIIAFFGSCEAAVSLQRKKCAEECCAGAELLSEEVCRYAVAYIENR